MQYLMRTPPNSSARAAACSFTALPATQCRQNGSSYASVRVLCEHYIQLRSCVIHLVHDIEIQSSSPWYEKNVNSEASHSLKNRKDSMLLILDHIWGGFVMQYVVLWGLRTVLFKCVWLSWLLWSDFSIDLVTNRADCCTYNSNVDELKTYQTIITRMLNRSNMSAICWGMPFLSTYHV